MLRYHILVSKKGVRVASQYWSNDSKTQMQVPDEYPSSPPLPARLCTRVRVCVRAAGTENLMRARKHFSQSVDLLKTGNARGLHGLCQTCASLASCEVGENYGIVAV